MEQNNNNRKKKNWQQINKEKRYKIEAYLEEGLKPSRIAELLGYSKRTIERERKLGTVTQRIRNNNNKKYEDDYITVEVYKADVAQRRHNEKASNKGRNLKIGSDLKLTNYIEDKILNEHQSPDVVIGRIKAENIEFDTSICTKTLYNYIDMGLFLNLSNKDLLIKSKPKKRDYKKIRKVSLNNKKGKSISAILTLIERKTRKSIYVLIKNKTQKEIINAVKKARKKLKGSFGNIFKTITADNGSEFLDSVGIKKAGKCEEVYYAHPYSSWERGSNENGNKMLRRFIPKGSNIGEVTEEYLQRIENWVNNYPRKILGYRSANEMVDC